MVVKEPFQSAHCSGSNLIWENVQLTLIFYM